MLSLDSIHSSESEVNRQRTAVFSFPLQCLLSPDYSKIYEHYTTSQSYVPAARVYVCENSDHEFPQCVRLEGSGDDDVAAPWECDSHKHCASIDVSGCLHTLLGQDVMHPILPVQFHLGKGK